MFSIYDFQAICTTLNELDKHRRDFMFRGLYALQQVMYQFNIQKESLYSLNLEINMEEEYFSAHMIDEVMKYRELENAEVDVNFYFYFKEFKIEYALATDRFMDKFMDHQGINFHNMEYEFHDIIDFVINRRDEKIDCSNSLPKPDYFPIDNQIWIETGVQYFATSHYEGASKHSVKEYQEIFNKSKIQDYLVCTTLLKITNQGVYKFFEEMLDSLDDCNHGRDCEYAKLKDK